MWINFNKICLKELINLKRPIVRKHTDFFHGCPPEQAAACWPKEELKDAIGLRHRYMVIAKYHFGCNFVNFASKTYLATDLLCFNWKID